MKKTIELLREILALLKSIERNLWDIRIYLIKTVYLKKGDTGDSNG